MALTVMTTSPRWLVISLAVCTRPRSGFVRERLAAVTAMRSDNWSPGRTGASQRNSSMPGEPNPAVRGR